MSVKLGFTKGQIIQEFYVDDDADQALRQLAEEESGNQLVDPDYEDVVDGAIVWWRICWSMPCQTLTMVA